jgi:hypothetical protein
MTAEQSAFDTESVVQYGLIKDISSPNDRNEAPR